jgi:predicted ATPase
LVILLDDLHWADEGSLELLTHLLQPGSEPFRLLVLAGARPELLTKQSRWANMTRVITLKPLEVSSEMVSEAYPDLRNVSKPVLSELAWRSDGNPYFLEELVKSLVKSGFIQPGMSEELIIEKLRSQPPESLRALLQARLDGLYVEAREILLLASVIGRVFWVGAVLEAAESSQKTGTGFLSPTPSRMEDLIRDALQQLEWAELVFPRAGTKFSDDQEYIFKHSLLRDVAYNLLPHKYRRLHHLAVARWLARRRDPDFRVMVATHLEKANLLEEAAQQYEVAAREAEARGASNEAGWLLEQAQQLRKKK